MDPNILPGIAAHREKSKETEYKITGIWDGQLFSGNKDHRQPESQELLITLAWENSSQISRRRAGWEGKAYNRGNKACL